MTDPSQARTYSFSQHCPVQQAQVQAQAHVASQAMPAHQPMADMQQQTQQLQQGLAAAVASGRVTPQQAVATMQALAGATASASARNTSQQPPQLPRQPPSRPSSRVSTGRQTPQMSNATGRAQLRPAQSKPEAGENSPAVAVSSGTDAAIKLGVGVNSPVALNTAVKSPAVVSATGETKNGSQSNLTQAVAVGEKTSSAAEMSPWQKPPASVSSNPSTPLNTSTASNRSAVVTPAELGGLGSTAVGSPLRDSGNAPMAPPSVGPPSVTQSLAPPSARPASEGTAPVSVNPETEPTSAGLLTLFDETVFDSVGGPFCYLFMLCLLRQLSRGMLLLASQIFTFSMVLLFSCCL